MRIILLDLSQAGMRIEQENVPLVYCGLLVKLAVPVRESLKSLNHLPSVMLDGYSPTLRLVTVFSPLAE